MQKGFGYGSLGAGRYGMGGGMGIRPPRGVAVPDFTTALIAAAMWGLTPDYQVEDATLGRVSGSLDSEINFGTKADAPYYCDIAQVIKDVGDTITVDRFDNQATGSNHFATGGAPPFFNISHTVVVSEAASADANQTCVSAGTMLNGKPSYVPDGITDPLEAGIFWDTDHWDIRAGVSGDTRRYRSFDDVATPDLCTTWVAVGPGNMASLPTVTTLQFFAEVQSYA